MSATAVKIVNSSSSVLVDNPIGSSAKNVIFCCQQNGSTATASAAEPTKKSVKVVEPATGKDKAAAGTAPTRKQGTPVRKTANHDTNHAKRSRSPEPNTSSSSSSSASSEGTESSTPTTSTATTSSSSSTPAVPVPAPAPKPAPAPEPPTLKGSGPNGELTLKDIPVSGISFQEVYNPEHEGPPTTKVIIYKPKSGKGQPTAKVIVTKVLD